MAHACQPATCCALQQRSKTAVDTSGLFPSAYSHGHRLQRRICIDSSWAHVLKQTQTAAKMPELDPGAGDSQHKPQGRSCADSSCAHVLTAPAGAAGVSSRMHVSPTAFLSISSTCNAQQSTVNKVIDTAHLPSIRFAPNMSYVEPLSATSDHNFQKGASKALSPSANSQRATEGTGCPEFTAATSRQRPTPILGTQHFQAPDACVVLQDGKTCRYAQAQGVSYGMHVGWLKGGKNSTKTLVHMIP